LAQPALADVARRREKWLILRFIVYGKMLTGRSPATRLKRRPLGGDRLVDMTQIDMLYKEIENNNEHTYHFSNDASEIDEFAKRNNYVLPDDLIAFYKKYSWLKLFISKYGDATYRFIPINEMHPTRIDILGKDIDEYGPKEWITVCDIMDGNYICIDLSSKNGNEWNYIDCFHETFARIDESMIVAKTFTELIEKALHSENHLFYLKEGFHGYGDGRPLTAENAAIRCEHPDPAKKGWIARFTINEKERIFDKYFRDCDYGGKEGALEAIRQFIEESKKA
jgi:hypothetical protein